MEILRRYLDWRPIVTSDHFFVAVFKAIPYEVSGAYSVVRSAFPSAPSDATASAVTFLFLLIVALSVFVFFLYQRAAGTTKWDAVSLAACFFLVAIAIDAETFRHWAADLHVLSAAAAAFLFDHIQRFYLIGLAVIVILASGTHRSIFKR